MRTETTMQQLLFNTVPLEVHNRHGDISTGTSFVVSHTFPECDEELFLVTNKHVVAGGHMGYMYFTRMKDGQPDIGKPFIMECEFFEQIFHDHPSILPIDSNLLPFANLLLQSTK